MPLNMPQSIYDRFVTGKCGKLLLLNLRCMNISIKSIILVCCSFIGFVVSTDAQSEKRYNRELKIFLNSLRDNFLVSWKYQYHVSTDTPIIRNYLSNKDLFGGVVLADDVTGAPLNKLERIELVRKIKSDTSSFFIKEGFIRGARLVSKQDTVIALQLSVPSFFRNYTLCVISMGDFYFNYTFVFKRVGKRKWMFVRRMGYIG